MNNIATGELCFRPSVYQSTNTIATEKSIHSRLDVMKYRNWVSVVSQRWTKDDKKGRTRAAKEAQFNGIIQSHHDVHPGSEVHICPQDDQKELIVENVVEITNTTSPTSSSETLSTISSMISVTKATQDGYSSSDSAIDISSSKKISTTNPYPSIKIIITPPSPTPDSHTHTDTATLSSNSTSYTPSIHSFSSTSTTSTSTSYNSTFLMPPTPHTHSHSSRASHPPSSPAIKLWLISRMNRKADTLPPRLIVRMMEMYDIREDELDPRMVAKLRGDGAAVGGKDEEEDEGMAMSLDFLGQENGVFNGVENIRDRRARLAGVNAQVTSTPQIKKPDSSIRKNTGANPRAWKIAQEARKQAQAQMQTQSYDFPPYSAEGFKENVVRSGGAGALMPILEAEGKVERKRREKREARAREKSKSKSKRGSMFISLFGEKGRGREEVVNVERKNEDEEERAVSELS